MGEKKEYVKLWLSYRSYFEAYSAAEVGRLVLAAMDYRESGAEPEFSGSERFIWPAIRRDIDESVAAQKAISASRSEAGKQGGRPESEKANSTNIVACARGKRPDPTEVSNDDYAYSWIDSTTGETKTLNKIEKAIFRKYINDKNPIFHYPVITHTQVIHCENGASFTPKIATYLD